MQDTYFVHEVSWNKAQSSLQEVRMQVFVYEQRVDQTIESDGKDPDCHHVLVTDIDGQPIGAGRMTAEGKIGRISVLMPYRGIGLGSRILAKLIEVATRESISPVKLNAQVHALPFYERHKFIPSGPVFMEAGIPHQSMKLDII